MASTGIFNETLGLEDYAWFLIIGTVILICLLFCVCYGICIKRAKRRAREEALEQIQHEQRIAMPATDAPVHYIRKHSNPVEREMESMNQQRQIQQQQRQLEQIRQQTGASSSFDYHQMPSPKRDFNRTSSMDQEKAQEASGLMDRIQALRMRQSMTRDSGSRQAPSTTEDVDSYAGTVTEVNSLLSTVAPGAGASELTVATAIGTAAAQDDDDTSEISSMGLHDSDKKLPLQKDNDDDDDDQFADSYEYTQRNISQVSEGQFSDPEMDLPERDSGLSADLDLDTSIVSHSSIEF